MKIVISHKGVKREIEGDGFNICASSQDFKTIVDGIQNANVACYGWIRIRDPETDKHCSGPNTPPKPWTE